MHRLLWPARYLKNDFPQHCFHTATADPEFDYDVLLSHGLLHPRMIDCFARWKAKGKVVVWGADDDYRSVPKWSPCHLTEDQLGTWYLARELADVILVSTDHLAVTFDRPQKTVVARNLLDLNYYPATTEPADETDGLVIAWSGSKTHAGDLAPIVPVVTHCLQKFKGRIEFVFMGYCHPDLVRDHLHNGVHWQEGVPLSLYTKVLGAVKPHVWLSPIDPCKFNASKCVVGDTLVVTEQGIKPMNTLVENTAKHVRLEDKQQMVRSWYRYDQQPTVRVETVCGYSIEGTPTHKLRLPDGTWKQLADLTPGDKVDIKPFDILQREYQTVFYPLFMSRGDNEDLVGATHHRMMPRVVINENWGRFLGYVMGDGHVAKATVGVSCSTDYPDIMDDVRRLFTALGVRYGEVVKADARRPDYLPAPKGVDIKGNSKGLCKLLGSMGIVKHKQKVFAVPQVILDSPKSVIREFLRGLFESDGCVFKDSPTLNFCSKSENFARQVHFLLLGFGIKSKLVSRWNSQYERDYWYVVLGRQACDRFHTEIGFISQAKNERLASICSKGHSNAYKAWEWADEVKTITSGRTADVFDLEVAHDHYYLANGFVSHNSNIRVLEGWALSAAVVATPFAEYGIVRNGVDGLTANSTDEWIAALEKLITDRDYSRKLAVAGRKRVEEIGDWRNPECRKSSGWVDYVHRLEEMVGSSVIAA